MESEPPSGPFEGPEKLLELWFAPSAEEVGGVGLLDIDDGEWERVLKVVQCQILSKIDLPLPVESNSNSNQSTEVANGNNNDKKENKKVKAYLLSESSLFVWPHKMILKTCGTTTLLLGLDPLLDLAQKHASLNKVWRCFYSRKSFMFPHLQKGPHRAWSDEVDLLVRYFPTGASYNVGNLTGDHWLLFLTPPLYNFQTQAIAAAADGSDSSGSTSPSLLLPDQTLEILMTDLDEECASRFYMDKNEKESSENVGASWTDRLGFKSLMPDAVADAYAFSPCGYSANFIQYASSSSSSSADEINNDAEYATVHVTPEPSSSYASFETNIALQHLSKNAHRLVSSVIRPFKPKRLCLTLFISRQPGSPSVITDLAEAIMDPLLLTNQGYRRSDKIIYEFDGYDLIYASFYR